MKNKKQLPQFKNEDEEREFWTKHDLSDVFNPKTSKRFRPIFTNLKPSTQSITIRLPKLMVDSLKMLANEQDVPYQSLLKTYLNEKIQEAFHRKKV